MGRPIIGITCELDAARWGDWLREAAISPGQLYPRGGAGRGRAGAAAAGAAGFGGLLRRAASTGWCSPAAGTSTPRCTTSSGWTRPTCPSTAGTGSSCADARRARGRRARSSPSAAGLHVLTVARGGTLTQHLPGHRPDRARYLPHDVHLADDSVLGRLLGSQVQVPAAHHQAPDRLGDGLTVTGWSPDGEVGGGRGSRRARVRRRRALAPRGKRRPPPADRPGRGGRQATPRAGQAGGTAAKPQAHQQPKQAVGAEAQGGHPRPLTLAAVLQGAATAGSSSW